uniref:Alpha/beta hydrolase fold-3 domain-containing protein n=1 Tax=Alexandrium monilatum TaxID=311494 RepID=A0A7S4T1J3_9DINO
MAEAKPEKRRAAEAVGLGWTSDELAVSSIPALWRALGLLARDPGRFMDASKVVVADRVGYIARALTVTSTGRRVTEHIYSNERSHEMVFRVVDGVSKRETNHERVIAIKESPVRLEFYQRHAADGCRTYWQAPVEAVKDFVEALRAQVAKLEADESGAVGLGFLAEEIRGTSHDAVWRAMVVSTREPGRFFDCSDVRVEDRAGFVRRSLRVNGQAYTELIRTDERRNELVFRKLGEDGEGVERVAALRSHPLQLEFFQRSTTDGFRVHWSMPQSAVLKACDAYVREARRMDGTRPSIIGYGIGSDPIRECSQDALMMAIKDSIQRPWKILNVEASSCKIVQHEGFIERIMRLKATGEILHERVTIDEENGEVTFRRYEDLHQPSSTERVLAIRHPLRLEMYERAVNGEARGTRVDWQAPYEVAHSVFNRLVGLARSIGRSSGGDVVGYGLASKPISGLSKAAVWKAMVRSVRVPAEYGMAVDRVAVREMPGYLQRSMRLLERPGSPVMTENVRVLAASKEITYRPVVRGEEVAEERVFALRVDPLRCELFSRRADDQVRIDWQAPRTLAIDIFASVEATAAPKAPAAGPSKSALAGLAGALQWLAATRGGAAAAREATARSFVVAAEARPVAQASPFTGAATRALLGRGTAPPPTGGLLTSIATTASLAACGRAAASELRKRRQPAQSTGKVALAAGAVLLPAQDPVLGQLRSCLGSLCGALDECGRRQTRDSELLRRGLEAARQAVHDLVAPRALPGPPVALSAPAAALEEASAAATGAAAVHYEAKVLELAGEQRDCGIFTPANASESTPALVFLHGFTRSHQRHHGLARRLASQLGFRVVLPNLPPLLEAALLGSGDEARGRAVEEAVALVQWLRAMPGVDPRRVVLGGFSAGGAAALEAAARLSELTGTPPLACMLLDAVPWARRTAAAAACMAAPPPGGVLLLESEPSAYNEELAFRREVLPRLPPEASVRVVSVSGSKHVDVEDSRCGGPVDELLGGLLWGEPCPEKTATFQDLAVGFVRDVLESSSLPQDFRTATAKVSGQFQHFEGLSPNLAVRPIAVA